MTEDKVLGAAWINIGEGSIASSLDETSTMVQVLTLDVDPNSKFEFDLKARWSHFGLPVAVYVFVATGPEAGRYQNSLKSQKRSKNVHVVSMRITRTIAIEKTKAFDVYVRHHDHDHMRA